MDSRSRYTGLLGSFADSPLCHMAPSCWEVESRPKDVHPGCFTPSGGIAANHRLSSVGTRG